MAVARHDDDSRAATWIVVATGVHAAVLVLLVLLPVHPARIATAPIKDDTSLEIAVTVERATPATGASVEPTPDDHPESVPTPRSTPEAILRQNAANAVIGDTVGTEVGGATLGDPPKPPAPEGTGTGVVPVPYNPDQLGLGGIGANNPFLPKHEEKETPQSQKEAMNERLRASLRGSGLGRDTGLGLGPEGPALSALSESTRSSLAPLKGWATFLVRSDREGLVSGIELIDSAGGTGWGDAGKLALEALKSKRFRVPRGANGLSMRIEVRSDMKLPNGQDAPVGVRAGESGATEFTMPDVSNLGSSPRRVVKSRIVSTEVL